VVTNVWEKYFTSSVMVEVKANMAFRQRRPKSDIFTAVRSSNVRLLRLIMEADSLATPCTLNALLLVKTLCYL
jgi:hypothetical protein